MADLSEFRESMLKEKTEYLWRYWNHPGKGMTDQERLVVGRILRQRGEQVDLPSSAMSDSGGLDVDSEGLTGPESAQLPDLPEETGQSDLALEQLRELRRISGKLDKQNKELSKVVSRLGLIVFFFIVVPLVVGFCSVISGTVF
jgi:hypothetical protein